MVIVMGAHRLREPLNTGHLHAPCTTIPPVLEKGAPHGDSNRF